MKKILHIFFGFLLFVPHIVYGALPSTAHLPVPPVSRWQLTEVSGIRYDSVGSNDLTDNNTVGSSTGPFGDVCADFEAGNSESLSISDNASLSITGDLSFSVWLYVESAPGTYAVMGKSPDDAYRLFYRNSSGLKLNADFWNGASETDVTVAQDLGTATWKHVVITYDVSVPTIKIYVDGSPLTVTVNSSAATAIANTAGAFYLGALNGANFYDGLMQDAVIWNVELSSVQVAALYDSYYPVCGDGIINGDDECDDGNTGNGDGCSSVCLVESGYMCSGEPSVCTPISSSSSSSSPSCTGTGCLSTATGTLVIGNSNCVAMSSSGSGGSVCVEWQHLVEIPAVRFMVRTGQFAEFHALALFGMVAILVYFIGKILAWFWRVLTSPLR